MPVNTSCQKEQRTYGDPLYYYYSAKTTGGTTITDTILDGYCFAFDFVNTATTGPNGFGQTVTRPETANLQMFAGVAINVTPGFVGPGWVQLVPVSDCAVAFTKSNATAFTTFLGLANGLWSLATVTAVAALADFAKTVGLALETSDTSTTAANKRVKLRPLGNL